MLITQEVESGVAGDNVKRYEERGYIIPRIIDSKGNSRIKQGTKIVVKVEDLMDASGVLVDVECDGCKSLLTINWANYKKCVQKDGKYYCQRCAHNGNKKYVSFYQWCYDNLTKEEADMLLSRWDYDLNIDKDGRILTPKGVSFSSGVTKNGYWFKCLNDSTHVSEQKSISSFTNGRRRSIDCSQCNIHILALDHPELVKSLDGISYPEKFMSSVLEQLNIIFKAQLSKTTLIWCNGYRYDFYLNDLNCVIETHGMQHYRDTSGYWNMSLKETQQNDKNKEQLAKSNSIDNYITVDCRKSEIDWIKNNIMKSKLPKLLGFKESNIDWLKCHEYALSSLVKKTCELWSEGINDTLKIANILMVNRATISRYLSQGSEIGWCTYDSNEEINKYFKEKKVICLTTEEIFDSISSASRKYGILVSAISKCCVKKQKITKHPETRKIFEWMFYDEYIINNQIILPSVI